ncbi:MAG: ABC transporter permease [Chlorobiota bacterium]|jgi:ABC-2 type transport system permease protein|nr:ABC transporter permease [Chlorobiota bacterium]QQS66389.1 MAG: ABC transporter permease [Chlorobiota bacterium]
MNYNRIKEIARWEFIQRVRSKLFITSIVLLPILIVGFSIIPGLIMTDGISDTKTIGLIDSTGDNSVLINQLCSNQKSKNNKNPSYVFVNYTNKLNFIEGLKKADNDVVKELSNGTVVIKAEKSGKQLIEFRGVNVSDILLNESIEQIIEKKIIQGNLIKSGVDTAAYNLAIKGVEFVTVKLNSSGEEERGSGFIATFGLAYLGIFLFLFLTLTTGQTLVRSLVEEKSNRIMEILISGGTADELMWGKLIGLTGVALLLLLCWSVMGVVAITYFASIGKSVSFSSEMLLRIPLMFLYLMLGYFFFAAIFIGIGSLVTTEQEAQAITGYLTILFTGPMAFIMVIMQNPDSTMSKVLSFIPLLTPSLMMIRIAIKMPSIIEILGTLCVMLFSTIIIVWAASKIFRTAILLTGKRPTFREALSWLKNA